MPARAFAPADGRLRTPRRRPPLDPPWSLRISDEAPLTVVALVRGEAWVLTDDRQQVRLGPDDIAIVRGPEHYTVADDPARPPQWVIGADQRCTTLHGDSLAEAMDQGVRTWGNTPDGATVTLTGTYNMRGDVSGRLLSALP